MAGLRRVDILIGGATKGDATSAHTFTLARLLQNHGLNVRIYSNDALGPLPTDIQNLAQHVHPGEYVAEADLTIVKYPIWFPLAERVRETSGATLFWYHGVTPPSLWGTESHRDFLKRAELGTELTWYAHLAVADSPFTRTELHRHSGYPLERIRVVPLSINVDTFLKPPEAGVLAELRRKWGLKGKRVVLYTGRVAGNKRIDLLVNAVANLLPRLPDLHLLVVGDTDTIPAYREVARHLQAQAEVLGIADRVTITGRVPVIEPYYYLSDVYVLPSQHEGFGVPLIEAMAAGVPIVASASGAMPWVLEAGEEDAAGLVFSAGDLEALVGQLQRVLTSPQLAETLVTHGKRRVREFTLERFETRAWAVIEETWEKAYTEDRLKRAVSRFYEEADVALRNYRVRSNLPIVGPLIEWFRRQSTTHIKEAYLDRIVERQVIYNRTLAREVDLLRLQVASLQEELCHLKAEMSEKTSAHEG